MFEIVKVTLENAMDLVLAHKKASRLGERLKLPLSTQTTFSTAVSEVCREVIDRTDSGILILGVLKGDLRYSLAAKIKYPKETGISTTDMGYQNAQKLLPQVTLYSEKNCEVIELSIGLPRSSNVNPEKIKSITDLFASEPPYTAYEALKIRNLQLHEQAEEREEKLIQSKVENELKNEFISLASHELKTPVTIIKAYAQMALSVGDKECSTKVRGFLAKIDSQSVKLTSLIQQLLDVSKIQKGKFDYKMESVDLNTYLTETVSLVRHSLPDSQLEVQLDKTANIHLDKLRIEQVLTNILENAAKYSKSDSLIQLRTNLEENQVTVSITDEGIGMSKNEVQSIFDKFYRASNVVQKYSGFGMGLYISSKIIKEHGGSIWVESTEGKGSTFYFSLPV